MDVTCERCKTGYEFDDALVSERGTSVRCTQCGHTFKVRRHAAAPVATSTGKEKWLVRTIDGRELEFRALRELQAAIGKGLVRRDDVLARENGRPRRLGSIAELDPFFSARTLSHAQERTFAKTSLGVGPPRARSNTPPGLGHPEAGGGGPVEPSAIRAVEAPRASMGSGTTEHSVAIPLAAAISKHPSDPPIRGRTASRASFASNPHASPIPAPRPPAHSVPRDSVPEFEDITHQVSRSELEAAVRAAETAAQESVARALPLPSEPPPPPPPPPSPEAEPPAATSARGPSSGGPGLAAGPSDAGASGEGPGSGPVSSATHGPELLPPPPVSGGKPTSAPPVRPAKSEAAEAAPTPTPETPEGRGSLVDIRPSAMSLVNLTPTPADVRYSYVDGGGTRSSDGRFSAAESRRVGSARWIFALLLVGAVVVGGAVVARRYLTTDAQTQPAAQDERLTALLAEAEKALLTGDLESAKERVDIASGLAERDPRVAELAARIANERAELPWLELRFLGSDDPSRPAVKQRLAERIGRAKAAAARAAELAPSSPAVTRERIDALRLAGELPAARALVPQVASVSSDARTQLALAALDLAEDAPPFATLIPRLARAATDDGDGGRARLLLVYALGRSGDVARARTELEKLRATHPLRAPAASFLERTEKGVAPSLDIESLPDADAPAVEGASGDEIPADFRRALEAASQAGARGDYNRAEKYYRAALQKEPGNPEALCGLGHVARAKGDNAGAIANYKRSVEAAPGYLPALVPLADLLWDGGDRGAAQGYYKRIVQLAPSGPAAARARERSGAAADEPAPAATPSVSPDAPPAASSADAPPPAPPDGPPEGPAPDAPPPAPPAEGAPAPAPEAPAPDEGTYE